MTESRDVKQFSFKISGVDCPSCFGKIRDDVMRLDGVAGVDVNVMESTMRVAARNGVSADDIRRRVSAMGYEAAEENAEEKAPDAKTASPDERIYRLNVALTALSGTLIAVAALYEHFGSAAAATAFYAAGMVAGGLVNLRKALVSLRRLSLDMNILMLLAAAGAIAIGDLQEGAVVLFLFALAGVMEARSMDRARNAVRALLRRAPNTALVRRDGAEVEVDAATVTPGEVIIIRPGERIPLDGTVLRGNTEVDQSSVTGESMPVDKSAGDEVFAGALNGLGSIEIRADRRAGETVIARIITLVAEAQSRKAAAESAIDRFARYYTPAVVAAAVLTAALPPLVFGLPFDVWFYRALVLLVISCPCALVISTPVSIVSALSSAAANGVLIKGGIHLENLGSVKAVAFDKTGTLTRGRPEVCDIIPLNGRDAAVILSAAAAVESRSEHHLAKAIIEAAKRRNLQIPALDCFDTLPGKGAIGVIGEEKYFVGNHRYCEETGSCSVELHDRLNEIKSAGRTPVIVGDSTSAIGIIVIEDQPREESPEALRRLAAEGIDKLIMLTGDEPETAKSISTRIGITDYRAGLLPEDKLAAVESLLKEHGKVAMVGDGINDAPALALATVGVAMGVAGTDAALETADVALMSDDLLRLPWAVRLSRRTLRIIRFNVAFAVGLKAAFLVAAMFGAATLWMAVFADMGASLIVIANGMRLLKAEKIS